MKKKTISLPFLCSVGTIFTGTLAPVANALPESVSSSGWELVFSDNFDGTSLNENNWTRIDYVNWTVSDWRKYQSSDDGLVEFGTVDGNSAVTLWGKYGKYTTQSNQTEATSTYACGGIYSLNKFKFQYGYVEVRAKFDCVQGVWPAIWMMPVSGTWPLSGEIDIMEHLNYQGSVYQTIHWGTNDSGNTCTTPGWTDENAKYEWHTYGVEWTESGITFYLDGKATNTVYYSDSEEWPFSTEGNEFYLIIDQQIGGSWVENSGETGIDQETLQNDGAAFCIDYVNVYSSSKYAHTTTPEPSTFGLFAGIIALAFAITRRQRRKS